MGRNTLTSPADGFSVPSSATIASIQNVSTAAKPRPVATITTEAPSRTCRRDQRSPMKAITIVATAEPTSVSVAIAADAAGRQPQQAEVRRQHDAGEPVGEPAARPGEQHPSGVGREAAAQRHRGGRRPLDGARHARFAQISTSRSMIRSGSQAPSSKLLNTTTVRSRLG